MLSKGSLEGQMMFMLNGGFTKRFHTVMTLREHTVGHHSFGVACLCYLLSNGQPSATLLMAALTHDVAEQYVGDIPSPTKRKIPALKEQLDNYEYEHLCEHFLDFSLLEEEQHILKLADIFDGMWNCIQERKLGNKGIDEAYTNFKSYALSMTMDEVATSIFVKLNSLWSNYA